MSDNLKLWRLVETTSPAHVKNSNINGRSITAINPMWQKQKATEVFGAQGIKWGVKPGSEVFERINYDRETLLQYTAIMYFSFDGETGEIPIAAAAMERQIVKRGKPDEYVRLDNESIKKVRTDALTKGLSELGFNADVFKGLFDNHEYKNYTGAIDAEKAAEAAEAAAIKEAEDYAKWKVEAIKEYDSLSTVKAITTLHTSHCRKAANIGDKRGVKAFTDAKDARINELKSKTKEGQ